MDVTLHVLLMQLFALPVVHMVLISVSNFYKLAVHIFKNTNQKQNHKETAHGWEIF